MILKDRTLELLEQMLHIHSPSKKEKQMADFVVSFLSQLGAEIYLDHCQYRYGGDSPVIFAKFIGDLKGPGITLNGHMDVIEPNKDVTIIKTEKIWRTDGRTTLGGDDKAGLAAILAVVEYIIQQKLSHPDLYLIITPGEEMSMLGSRNINWTEVYKHMSPAKNMLVVDNASKSNKVAYQAPACYRYQATIKGQKAHAGIEPEKGISAIQQAAKAIAELQLLRIDSETTANISTISADFPNNVVPDTCSFTGELRAHDEAHALEILNQYEQIIKKYSPVGYTWTSFCDYPVLRSKDQLAFVHEVIEAYRQVGVTAQPQIIGGGSDANFFAAEGFNAAIIGVGMEKVHTTEEYLEIDELLVTTEVLLQLLAPQNIAFAQHF